MTARAAKQVDGNPDISRPEDAVGNCYPGLDIDVRNLDRRFFPGLVFEFVAYDATIERQPEPPERLGALLLYAQGFGNPELLPGYLDRLEKRDRDSMDLAATNGAAPAIDKSGHGRAVACRRMVPSIDRAGRQSRVDDSDTANGRLPRWDGRLAPRHLEPGEVKIGLRRRDGEGYVELTGWRRFYTEPRTGVLSLAYQPGELLMSLCSPLAA